LLGFPAGPRVGLIIYLGKMLEIKVCVNLRRADICMAQHFLHTAQVAG
jgi:hypothetical protein